MKKNNLYMDLSMIAFLALCCMMIAYGYIFSAHPFEQALLLNVTLLIVLLTYFTSLTLGLIVNLILIFVCGSYALFQVTTTGTFQYYDLSFWLIMSPLMTVVVSLMSLNMKRLQRENESMQENKSRLGLLDEQTRLRTLVGFEQDYQVFMATSKRYHIPLSVMTITLRHKSALESLLNRDQLTHISKDISVTLGKSTRPNDILYLIDKKNFIWALLLFVDSERTPIIIDRVKDNYDLLTENSDLPVELDLQIGSAQYDPEKELTAGEFISEAIKQMQYDVTKNSDNKEI